MHSETEKILKASHHNDGDSAAHVSNHRNRRFLLGHHYWKAKQTHFGFSVPLQQYIHRNGIKRKSQQMGKMGQDKKIWQFKQSVLQITVGFVLKSHSDRRLSDILNYNYGFKWSSLEIHLSWGGTPSPFIPMLLRVLGLHSPRLTYNPSQPQPSITGATKMASKSAGRYVKQLYIII